MTLPTRCPKHFFNSTFAQQMITSMKMNADRATCKSAAMQNCCCARKALDRRARGVREIHPPKGGVFSARLHGSADEPLLYAKNRISLLFCKVFVRSAKCVQVGINAIKYETIGVVASIVAVFCCCSTIEKFFCILHFADFALCKVSFFGAFGVLHFCTLQNAKSLQTAIFGGV